MINKQNYFGKVQSLKASDLPSGLKSGFDFTKEATDNYSTWDYYNSETAIKEKIDEYFKALSEYLGKTEPKDFKTTVHDESKAREFAKYLIQAEVKRGDTIMSLRAGQQGHHGEDYSAMIKGANIVVDRIGKKDVNIKFTLHSIYNELLDEFEQKKTKGETKKKQPNQKTTKLKKLPQKKLPPTKKKTPTDNGPAGKVNDVERIDEEVKLIKRFVGMQGKKKSDVQLLNLLAALQKAITEKRIRRTSPFKNEIDYMQQSLVKVVNQLRRVPKPEDRVAIVEIKPAVYTRFKEIAGSMRIRLSVNYLKRYIGIQGRALTKEKAKRLLDLLKKALKDGKIRGSDRYSSEIKEAHKSLEAFVKSAYKNDTLEVHDAVLNGLNGVLGCGCDEKKNAAKQRPEAVNSNPTPQNTVMNSLDFAKLKFDTIGFTGKWLDLIGDPSPGFRAMVFGRPKFGKSYLCMAWAGYLAKNHGNTLYVAREENLGATLQKKVIEKQVGHRCMDVSDYLPADLGKYEYIFLDSVSRLGLSPADLDQLIAGNKGKNFIEVHQTTKQGKSRGSQEHLHDVDIIIEVPERGKATQFGRFNQGGEMDIFGSDKPLCEEGDLPMAA